MTPSGSAFTSLLPCWCSIGDSELITHVLNPHNRPSVVVLFKLHGIKLPSMYSLWHLYIRATVIPNERGFFRKWALLTAQTHTWPKFREYITVQFSDLSRTSEPQHAARLRDYFGSERQRLKIVSVKWCPGHNGNHTQEGAHKAPPSVRDFAHLICAGWWNVIKSKKEMQVSSHSLPLWMLRPIE